MEVALGRIVPHATIFRVTSSRTKLRASSTFPSVVSTTKKGASSGPGTCGLGLRGHQATTYGLLPQGGHWGVPPRRHPYPSPSVAPGVKQRRKPFAPLTAGHSGHDVQRPVPQDLNSAPAP